MKCAYLKSVDRAKGLRKKIIQIKDINKIIQIIKEF